MALPAILTGQKNETEWRERRQEILRLFETYEYGKMPEITMDHVVYSNTVRHTLKNDIIYEARRIYFKKGEAFTSLRFEMYYREPEQGPIPAILMIDVFDTSEYNIKAPQLSEMSKERLPYEKIVDAGYGAVLIHTNDICEDGKQYERGILEFSPRREESDWGAIGAWAWGTSRVVDYLCQDPHIDEKRLAVLGVSRAGKTALWCGANDQRIAAVIPVVSGCGGASILRGKTGEHIRDMTKLFPHWTCEKYKEYAEREEELPVDQHMLLALCAPRPLYLSDAIEDDWADPKAAFQAAVLAGQVYELLGKKGLSQTEFPSVDTPVMGGDIAYHVRTGTHGITEYDWEQYLTFLKKYFG